METGTAGLPGQQDCPDLRAALAARLMIIKIGRTPSVTEEDAMVSRRHFLNAMIRD